VGPTPTPVTGMRTPPGAGGRARPLAELVLFLFVAGALASPAREVDLVFCILCAESVPVARAEAAH